MGELIDFKVLLADGRHVGKVKGFSSNGAQDLLIIEELSGKESEVPLVKPFIKRLSFKDRVIELELPKGLLADD